MARAGLYYSDVKKARDALLAQGRHPSVDAVRVALGNTGSKTTIHKYLKELEAEEGSIDGRKVSISDALQDIVTRLAARLHEEANERVSAIEDVSAQKDREHAVTVAAFQQELASLEEQLHHAQERVEEIGQMHADTGNRLQEEAISRYTAQQQVADLRERLAENEAHRQSLEEKHTHARNSLEHYRQSVKEQRDQDLRRNEQQLQQVHAELRQQQHTLVQKQEEVTHLNQEGARLVAALSQTEKWLYDEQAKGRRLNEQLVVSQAAERQLEVVLAQVAGNERLIEALGEQLAQAAAQTEVLSSQTRIVEAALCTAQTTLASQQEIILELHGHIRNLG